MIWAMATKVITTITDDLDDSPNAETTTFMFDGITWEIDLSAANREALRTSLAPYIDAGRRLGAVSRPRRLGRARSGVDIADIREWANANGFSVSGRGRIPADARAAYDAAH